ncbi:bromodomain testis-specific protein [Senna tora]|uniref:Bromodomain testis-specific protein n=1 Tax=Senna tora TaxID=362788 RepID=A0A835CH20_9FABA|nr:bromodomain testis-specific protein [Senna tora]
MKRKRGNKKGKPKVTPVISANETIGNKEEVSGLDDFGNNESDSGMEVDTPSSTGTEHHYNLANINPDGSVEKAAGKSPTSSDAPTQSDTDKSSQQQGLEKPGVNTERTEDSANSLPEIKLSVLSKKAGSIKIKSSKALGSSSNQTDKALPASGGNTHPKETKAPQKNPRYNKQELDAALVVIRKVMKMDAAEPFNVPVNPEALGIPDYFDIIDTPMDFGTICSNLETNGKYMNSEDVFKDVQYIWDNCYKYNNKGDYILDLMRRVKKNFMKYWTAAGLYSEQAKGTKERTSAEDAGLSGEGKVAKGGQTKHKSKKRHGRRHKHDCLCAICVLKRRRKEREENARLAKGNVGAGGDKLAKEIKEETTNAESPGSEDSSSNMDDSVGTDGDAEEEKGEEVKYEGIRKKHKGDTPKQSQLGDETALADGYTTTQQEHKKHKDSKDKHERAKLFEKFCFENPQLSSLCGTLFPKSNLSVWSGPHSLNHQPKTSTRTNPICAAIETYMK